MKRSFLWISMKLNWAKIRESYDHDFKIIEHKSLILRPLKNVDMYLQENKRTNLELAIKRLNNVVIQPGEIFSFWKLVGKPSKSKGYLTGLILNQGQIGKDIGGGLCQLGNLLFWMFAHSPLRIIERHRHGFDVFPDVNRKIPFGAGATLAYNYIDLQVKNESNESIKLELWLDNTHLRGSLKSDVNSDYIYKIEERNHQIKQQNWGTYSRHNEIYQIQFRGNKKVGELLLVENHALMMYSPLLDKEK